MQYFLFFQEAVIGLVWRDTKVNPGWAFSDIILIKHNLLYIHFKKCYSSYN